MPTANLAWTNQSTGDSPDTTKVERSDGFPFGHANAPTPTVLDNSAAGGLDPTIANGSYADTTLTGDAHYAYRVSTVKGSEVAPGIPTAMQFVHNPATDLGYPLGTPSTAATYNVSTAPFFHFDVNRSNVGYAHEDTISQGYGGMIRNETHAPTSFAASSYSTSPKFFEMDINGTGNVRKFLYQLSNQGNTSAILGANAATKECPDGLTVFAVASNQMNDISLGELESNSGFNIGGHPSGKHSTRGAGQFNSFYLMGSLPTPFTLNNPGPLVGVPSGTGPGGHDRPIHIMAFRINNSPDAFNSNGGLNESGSIKGQAFDGGNLIATTDDVVAKSYHNNAANPDVSNDLMAAAFDPYYSINLFGEAVSYYEHHAAEFYTSTRPLM